MTLLDGRVIALTGAGRGIGREVALLAAAEGAKLVVNDAGVNPDGTGHDGGPADEVAKEIVDAGGEAVGNYADVSTMEGGESVIQQALDTYGKLDGLVNLAAILRDRMVFNMSEEEWDTVVNVDLKGHFTTIKPASVIFRQQRYGRIVNFSSVSGLQGNPGQANYGAAKAGVAGLTRVVARDLGRYGVTCNTIAPGAMTRLTLAVPTDTAKKRAAAGIGGGWCGGGSGGGGAEARGGADRARSGPDRPDGGVSAAGRGVGHQRSHIRGGGRRHWSLALPLPADQEHPQGGQVDAGRAAPAGAQPVDGGHRESCAATA